MPVQPPSRQQLEWIADAFRMPLTDAELDVFTAPRGRRWRASPAWTSCPTSTCP